MTPVILIFFKKRKGEAHFDERKGENPLCPTNSAPVKTHFC